MPALGDDGRVLHGDETLFHEAADMLPHGVLFRVGAEEDIRKYLIKDINRLDAVIGLPANLFYNTSIPTCIVVLKKHRDGRDVLFIDASQKFEKGKLSVEQSSSVNLDVTPIVDREVNRAVETQKQIDEKDKSEAVKEEKKKSTKHTVNGVLGGLGAGLLIGLLL